ARAFSSRQGRGIRPRHLRGPLRGGAAGASQGQAGRRRSRTQEELCPAAPGGQSHGGTAPQRRRGQQRRRSAQGSLGNPGAQTGVSAIAQRAAMLPLADSRDGTVGLVLDPLRVGGLQRGGGREGRGHGGDGRGGGFSGGGGGGEGSPEPTPMATLSYGGIFGDNSGGATPQRHRRSTRPSRR